MCANIYSLDNIFFYKILYTPILLQIFHSLCHKIPDAIDGIHISLNITNKMQRYTIFFITVNAVHVSGVFFAHHQELINLVHSIRYMSSFLAAAASVGEAELTHASSSSKQASHIPDAVYTVFELLMMGWETAWNM